MDKRQEQAAGSLTRAKSYFVTYKEDLGEAATIAAVSDLDAAIAALADDHAGQADAWKSAQSSTVVKQARRDKLIGMLAATAGIAVTGRIRVPEPQMVRFQPPSLRTRDRALIADARAMAKAATDFKDAFVREGRPADFIEQIGAAADALEQQIIQRDDQRSVRYRAGRDISYGITRARNLLVVLTGFVRERFHDRPAMIDLWDKEIRIGRVHRRASVSAGQPPAPATPATPGAVAAA